MFSFIRGLSVTVIVAFTGCFRVRVDNPVRERLLIQYTGVSFLTVVFDNKSYGESYRGYNNHDKQVEILMA